MTEDELADQAPVDVVPGEDLDSKLVECLNDRVPHEVPSKVTTAIRASMAIELADPRPASVVQAGSSERYVATVKRRWPSFGTATVALVFFTMMLNVLVAWRSHHKVAAVVGDYGGHPNSATMADHSEITSRKISVAALFEFNLSLIQRELNHERNESTGAGFHERRRPTRPAEERNPEEIPDRSGAAVRPGFGSQRRSKLAGFVTA